MNTPLNALTNLRLAQVLVKTAELLDEKDRTIAEQAAKISVLEGQHNQIKMASATEVVRDLQSRGLDPEDAQTLAQSLPGELLHKVAAAMPKASPDWGLGGPADPAGAQAVDPLEAFVLS